MFDFVRWNTVQSALIMNFAICEIALYNFRHLISRYRNPWKSVSSFFSFRLSIWAISAITLMEFLSRTFTYFISPGIQFYHLKLKGRLTTDVICATIVTMASLFQILRKTFLHLLVCVPPDLIFIQSWFYHSAQRRPEKWLLCPKITFNGENLSTC